MGLDEVLESLKKSHNLERPKDFGNEALAVISGPIVQLFQTLMPSVDYHLMASAETQHKQKEELEGIMKRLERDPRVKEKLKAVGANSLPQGLKTIPYALVHSFHISPYVGLISGEPVTLGIVRETGLLLKSNGKHIPGIVAVESIDLMQYHGCMLLETGLIHVVSSFSIREKVFLYNAFIAPPGVPVSPTSSQVNVEEAKYQIFLTSECATLRNPSVAIIAKDGKVTEKIDINDFRPFFNKILQEARMLGAGENERIGAYRGLVRCTEYAIALANSYAQVHSRRS